MESSLAAVATVAPVPGLLAGASAQLGLPAEVLA